MREQGKSLRKIAKEFGVDEGGGRVHAEDSEGALDQDSRDLQGGAVFKVVGYGSRQANVQLPEKGFAPDYALKLVCGTHKSYKVKFWNYAAVEAIGKVASDAGLSEGAYIAVAASEKLHRDGTSATCSTGSLRGWLKMGGTGQKHEDLTDHLPIS